MGLNLLFVNFLHRIAVGAGMVFVLLLVVWLRTPRRAAIGASRRISH